MSKAAPTRRLERMRKPPGTETRYTRVVLLLPRAYEVAGCSWYPFALVERLPAKARPTFFQWNVERTRLTLLYREGTEPKIAEGEELAWLTEVLAKSGWPTSG